MRSDHAPKACITDEVCITQKTSFVRWGQKRFFDGAGYGNRTRDRGLGSDCFAIKLILREYVSIIADGV